MVLTAAQYHAIADTMAGTRQNVYQAAMRLFGREWTDEDFEALRRITGLFRCIECGRWLERELLSPRSIEVCTDCDESIPAEEEFV